MQFLYLGAAIYLTLTLLSIEPFPLEKGPEIGRTILTLVATLCWGGWAVLSRRGR